MQLSDMLPGALWRRKIDALLTAPGLKTTTDAAARALTPWPRYRKFIWFLTKTVCQLIWWEIILNRPILRWWRTPPQPRWRQMGAEFCNLAIEMGGVLIKLGQFLSMRPDLLPVEVTQELVALQDQLPAAALPAIVAAIEADLGQPLHLLFAWFAPQPLASASLGQVHLARLVSGEEVVVKVLRPGVQRQVTLDLRVVALLVDGLKLIRPLRQALDLDRLLTEFISVTQRELDLVTEAQNAERFARDFADDAQVHIPQIYGTHSGKATLTLENVGFIKVSQGERLDAVGIDRQAVAHALARIFLDQIFVTHFIHADPHPGNLFIKPLPVPAEQGHTFAPGDPVPYAAGRPFQIVLIDFGMAAEIPPAAQRWLREFAIGLGLRDARRVVQSYVTGGLLRPGVDTQRVEQMTAVLLENFQEMLIGLMPDLKQVQASHFLTEYADLIEDYPFQIPMDLLCMYRALGLVGSIGKQLDPDFELSTAAAPLARQLIWQEWQREWQTRRQAVTKLGQLLAVPPLQLEPVLEQVQKILNAPDLPQQFALPQQLMMSLWPTQTVVPEPRVEDQQEIQQLSQAVKRLTWLVMAICLLLTGLLMQTGITVADLLHAGANLLARVSVGWLLAPPLLWWVICRLK